MESGAVNQFEKTTNIDVKTNTMVHPTKRVVKSVVESSDNTEILNGDKNTTSNVKVHKSLPIKKFNHLTKKPIVNNNANYKKKLLINKQGLNNRGFND